jgi:CHAD domain-containing protein
LQVFLVARRFGFLQSGVLMATPVNRLPAIDPDSGRLNVVVDTPQGSRNITGRSFADVRKTLQDNLRTVRKRVLDEHNAFVVAAETLTRARERVKGWSHVADKWRSVGAGLRDTSRKARAAFRDAATDPSVPKMHEWRKQIKYVRYQLEVLKPLWPERMEELATEADRMGELLGDDHDLAVLRQMLSRDQGPPAENGERETLLALIDGRRAGLEQEVLILGERFFQDRPRELARRLKGYWKTWRGQTSSTNADELTAPA